MIYSTTMMRPRNNLQTAIFSGGRIDCNTYTCKQRTKNMVLIPIAIILVPSPSATNFRILHYHFRMIMISLALKDFFYRANHALAPSKHSINPLPGVIPKSEFDSATFAISPSKGVFVKFVIFPCRLT